ncbi:hypothetical protein MMC19_001385 [Ptychographa xylographoides]|nr:hypothetical protein [Ptychographa xylographoides]
MAIIGESWFSPQVLARTSLRNFMSRYLSWYELVAIEQAKSEATNASKVKLLKFYKHKTQGLHPKLREILDWMNLEGMVEPIVQFEQRKKRTITLMSDAMHSMTLREQHFATTAGQSDPLTSVIVYGEGASHALLNGLKLAKVHQNELATGIENPR